MSSGVLRRGSQAKKNEFGEVESKLREKKESKKLSIEFQDVPKEAPSHDPRSLPRDAEVLQGWG